MKNFFKRSLLMAGLMVGLLGCQQSNVGPSLPPSPHGVEVGSAYVPEFKPPGTEPNPDAPEIAGAHPELGVPRDFERVNADDKDQDAQSF